MATKDQYLASNNKKNGINATNEQYQNLNLNQSHQYFSGDTVSSKLGIYDSKKVQNYIEERQRKECSLWNKKDFNSKRLHNNFDQQEIEKEKRNCSNIGSSNSTLALHITAYENSNITASSTDSNTTLKDTKQIINGFELPRQQENDPPTPEVMQFKKSQKMANPSQSISKTQSMSSGRNGTSAQPKTQKEASLKSNVPASNSKVKSKIPAESAAGDYLDPKAIREPRLTSAKFKLQYEKKYFNLSANKRLWCALPAEYENSLQIQAYTDKFDAIGRMIKKTTYIRSGSFGSVSLCEVKGLKQQFVIKTLKNIQKGLEELPAELKVYSEISSEFFPRLFFAGIFNDGCYSLVTEYVQGGTLDDHLYNIKFNDIKFIAYEMAQGLKELHDRNLTHGDIKGDNVALTADGHIKLLDYGHSRNVSTPTELPKTPHMAPEVCDGLPAGTPADIYSFGLTLLTLMVKDDQNFDFKKMKGGADAKDFLKKCIPLDPERRIKKPLEHAYLALTNAQPSFIPGIFSIKKQQQPKEETENAKATFCFHKNFRYNLYKHALFRFPTLKQFESFK